MVNFADAVSKISYEKLMTTTPNSKGVKRVLHNVVMTNKSPYGALPTVLLAKDAMYQMGAKSKTGAKGTLKEFHEKMSGSLGLISSMAITTPWAKVEEKCSKMLKDYVAQNKNIK